MTDNAKTTLQHYLQTGRDTLLWKLEDLSEYDRRRPLTPTGTNLLGLVKHVAFTEAEYFSVVFGRPHPQALPWIYDETDPDAEMWATPEETTEFITGTYRSIWDHSDTVITELDLDTPGRVPWWRPETADVTLHRILIHMIAETHRHAGHADILRESIDGATGLYQHNSNLPPGDRQYWTDHRTRLEAAAAHFR
ncbi:DinB family protein [Glycomyces salinus]|uniref:DinB family protein n=1 Tax=Glycomyces salinus TaxID=980294 RepID=UPI0027D9EDC0|nr:DinB family protein [Glycomyces salinus]